MSKNKRDSYTRRFETEKDAPWMRFDVNDLLSHALQKVNYIEIAEYFKEEFE